MLRACHRHRIALLRILVCAGLGVPVLGPTAFGQLRIATYNTNNYASGETLPRPAIATVFEALGDQAIAGFARPVDILILQEQSTLATTTTAYVDLLNRIYGAGTYARGVLQGSTTGGGRSAVVYNTATVSLIGESQASTASTTGGPRATMRYEFRPVGYDEAADFYVYASHFKAVDDSASATRRGVEAAEIRANSDALGEGTLAIYAGDFNFYRSSEVGFQTFVSPGPGQAFDPVNRVGSWTNSSSYRDVHTQSPVTSATFSGQVTGGLDDRFDFQLVTGEVLDGVGFDLISGSYWALGNTGTHSLNGALSTGSVSALQARLPGYTTSQTTAVIDALMASSDHLPVVADYRLPAKLSVVSPSLPSAVLRGAVVGGSLAVSNAAPVSVAAGADTLAYAITGSGAVRASGAGTRLPLAAAASHGMTFDTSAAGRTSGTLTVTSASPQAAAARFIRSYSVDVIDRAAISALGGGDGIAAFEPITVSNAAAGAGTQRAAAAIVSRTISGGMGWSVSGLAVGQTIAAGTTSNGTAVFDSSGRLNGRYAATFKLGFEHADQSLPGTAAGDLGTLSWDLVTTVTDQTGSGSTMVTAGMSLAGYGLGSREAFGSTAVLEAGVARGDGPVTMRFDPPPATGLFASDVLTLGGTDSSAVVLSLSFDAAAAGGFGGREVCLGWFDSRPQSPTYGTWINAIAGNTANVLTQPQPFAGSWVDYVGHSGVVEPALAVGAWGIDSDTGRAWAVLDHASQFAVVSLAASPKPGDANLDGKVDVFDLVQVNTAGKYGTGLSAVWAEGDFNGDGVTSVFDLVAVNVGGAYGQGAGFGAPAATGSAAAVPEPGFELLPILAAVVLLARQAGGSTPFHGRRR